LIMSNKKRLTPMAKKLDATILVRVVQGKNIKSAAEHKNYK